MMQLIARGAAFFDQILGDVVFRQAGQAEASRQGRLTLTKTVLPAQMVVFVYKWKGTHVTLRTGGADHRRFA